MPLISVRTREEVKTISPKQKEAFPTSEVMENSPTGKMQKIKGFFKEMRQTAKHGTWSNKKYNKVGPVPQQHDTGQSVLDPEALQDLTDPQPGPSVLVTAARQDPADPQPGPSVLKPMALQDPDDPLPNPLVLKPTALKDLTDLQMGSSVLNPADPQTYRPLWPVSRRRRVGDPVPYIAPGPFPYDQLYEYKRIIGRGGNGSVYEGIRKSDKQKIAIKFIRKKVTDEYIKTPGCSDPVFAEVAINLLLRQPPLHLNIVYMLEWFDESEYILILEYPHPCKSLRVFLKNNRPQLTESQARDLMFQAVLAAKHCLDRGIFHCSIKPDNMLVNTDTMELKLIDFSGSRIVKSSGYTNEHLGGCWPPEYPIKYHAGPTTVYGLGTVLYEMVTGQQPYDRMTYYMRDDPTVSRECQDLMSRCLISDPTERPTLEEILQHEWFHQG